MIQQVMFYVVFLTLAILPGWFPDSWINSSENPPTEVRRCNKVKQVILNCVETEEAEQNEVDYNYEYLLTIAGLSNAP